jgi:hypothetical protein
MDQNRSWYSHFKNDVAEYLLEQTVLLMPYIKVSLSSNTHGYHHIPYIPHRTGNAAFSNVQPMSALMFFPLLRELLKKFPSIFLTVSTPGPEEMLAGK